VSRAFIGASTAFSGVFLILLSLLIGLATVKPARALPEYASQTGEPCSTCHISPSGGGSRTVRGQAWVGNGKPGTVPDTLESLALLGIEIKVDPAQYTTIPASIPAAQPLPAAYRPLNPATLQQLHPWLSSFGGN
jgi:hypothetical protein